MDTEKRLFLALALSMMIVIAFSWMNAGDMQPVQSPERTPQSTNQNTTSNNNTSPSPEQQQPDEQIASATEQTETPRPVGPWSWLQTNTDTQAGTVQVKSDLYEISFSTKGAIPTSWKLIQYEELFSDKRYLDLQLKHGSPQEQILAQLEMDLLEKHGDSDKAYHVDAIDPFYNPGEAGLSVQWGNGQPDQNIIYETDASEITITEPQDVVFTSEHDGIVVTKTFRFYPENYRVDHQITIENTTEQPIEFGESAYYDVNWLGGFGFPSFRWDATNNAHLQIEGSVTTLTTDALVNELQNRRALSDSYTNPRMPVTENPVGWVAVGQKYFLSAIVPQSLTRYAFKGVTSTDDFAGMIKKPDVGVRMPLNTILPGKAHTDEFTLYVGPMDETTLAQAEAGLEDANQMFLKSMVGPIAQLMLSLLQGLHSFVPNYGMAIILLTLLVKLIMLPIYQKQMKSMKKMQALQPHMNALKEQYKNDPQKLQKEQMELFKKHNVNPLAGCLPILITIPIFIALYATFNMAVELRGAPFIGWITDLSSPDRAFFIPVGTWIFTINILPIAYSALMFWNMSQNKVEGPNAAVMKIMPVMFIFIFWSIASGVILYFVVSMTIDVIQRKILDQFQDDPTPVPVEPTKKDKRDNKKKSKK